VSGENAALEVLDRLYTRMLHKLTPTSTLSLHYAIRDCIESEYFDMEELMERWSANLEIENETRLDEVIIRFVFDAYISAMGTDSDDIYEICDRVFKFSEQATSHIETPS
jgi:hypothetical protein